MQCSVVHQEIPSDIYSQFLVGMESDYVYASLCIELMNRLFYQILSMCKEGHACTCIAMQWTGHAVTAVEHSQHEFPTRQVCSRFTGFVLLVINTVTVNHVLECQFYDGKH